MYYAACLGRPNPARHNRFHKSLGTVPIGFRWHGGWRGECPSPKPCVHQAQSGVLGRLACGGDLQRLAAADGGKVRVDAADGGADSALFQALAVELVVPDAIQGLLQPFQLHLGELVARERLLFAVPHAHVCLLVGIGVKDFLVFVR